MAANLPALYAEAWSNPRQSMRRILSLDLSERDRFVMVAITGVLFAIPVLILFRTIEFPPLEDGTPMPEPSAMQVVLLVMFAFAINYYFTAALIRGIGSLFGGEADYTTCKTVSAWTLFVIGIANVFLTLLSFSLAGTLGSIIGSIFFIVSAYISSAYVAEAHRFASTGKVVLVYLGIILTVTFFFTSFLTAPMQ